MTGPAASGRPEGRLSGKVAIVTGAGSRDPGVGTGVAIASLFAQAGAQVALVDLDADRAQSTLHAIRDAGGDSEAFIGDVSQAADCTRIVTDVLARFGGLDILVNNVGIVPARGPLHEVDDHEWDRVIAVNLRSVMLMTKHSLPPLIASGHGAIVNISSTGSMISTGQTPAYGASKAAMNRLTADTAVAYGRSGVRVNAIAPGNIHTPLSVSLGRPSDPVEWAQGALSLVSPLRGDGNAWDVAWAALFLASDESRFVTAVTLPVDGGLTQVNPLTAHAFITSPL